MLRVINLQAGYGALTVIDGISLRVEQGEVIALLGGNGAGKSTLLKTIAGLIPPTEGRILLDGKTVTGWPAERLAAAGLTLVPEGRGLFPGMSVLENLRMGGYARRLSAPRLAEQVTKMYELFPGVSGTTRLARRPVERRAAADAGAGQSPYRRAKRPAAR